jgi:hypothetical protein
VIFSCPLCENDADALQFKELTSDETGRHGFRKLARTVGRGDVLSLDAAWRRFVSCVALPSHRLIGMPAFDPKRTSG